MSWRPRKPRTCYCTAYPWPHRAAGGLCRYPDPPTATYDGDAGHAPVGTNRRSAVRRRLLARYALHPIRDQALIRRWLPKLYVAWCRRHGLPFPEQWFGGYVPAMRVSGEGPRAGDCPPLRPVDPEYLAGRYARGGELGRRRGPLRGVVRRRLRDELLRGTTLGRRKVSVPPEQQLLAEFSASDTTRRQRGGRRRGGPGKTERAPC